jgi:hypothetical protein
MTLEKIIFLIVLVTAYFLGCYALGKIFDSIERPYRHDNNNDKVNDA